MNTKTNFAIKSIVILFLLGVGIFSCKKTADPPPPPPPPSSTLTIVSFDTVKVGATSATLAWKDNSNKTITSRTLSNTNTGESFDVFSLSSYEVKGLKPASFYNYTLKVEDASGKVVSKQVSFFTKELESSIVSIDKISYDHEFAIIGNAQSDTLRIRIKNLSSKKETIPLMSASFGTNSSAVNTLRYRLSDTSRWTILKMKDGLINFKDLALEPGMNNIKAIFAIKPYPGVPDNAPLVFTFQSMDDGEGGGQPKGGWPNELSVGRVNSHTMPTLITGPFGWSSNSLIGQSNMPPGASGTQAINTVINLWLSGPAPARIVRLRLKNPYAAFSGMEWGYADPDNDFRKWYIGRSWFACTEDITNFYWEGDSTFINLNLGNVCNILDVNGSHQDFVIHCGEKNLSNVVFHTEDYTPGLIGFVLVSKFDFVVLNSDGQVIDFSDALVSQDGVTLEN